MNLRIITRAFATMRPGRDVLLGPLLVIVLLAFDKSNVQSLPFDMDDALVPVAFNDPAGGVRCG